MTAKKAQAARDPDVSLWLIEHGGAPMRTTVNEDGGTVTSPTFPEPMPTLAQAMAAYPCLEKHPNGRYPAVCCVALRKKKGAKLTADGIEGATCGRSIEITNLPGLKKAHVGCPICRPYPEGYDIQAEEAKVQEERRLSMLAERGPRRQRRAAARSLKKAAKKRLN